MRSGDAAHRSDEPSDADLWRLIAYGDHQAFTRLYERHAKAVWNYAYRLTGSSSAAEDLLATTFMTAWHRSGEVRLIRDSALPWLYTVANNHVRGERRRLGRLLRIMPKLVADPVPDHAEKVTEDSAARDRLRRVLAAIEELPRGEREAVKVCLLGGTSTADAAELFGIAEASVRSRLARARAHLQTLTEEASR